MSPEPNRQADNTEQKDGGQPLVPAVSLQPTDAPRSPGPSGVQHEYIFAATAYTGPIPPPAIIRDWEALLPGSADRLLKMAEKQSEHRMALEKAVIEGDSSRAWWGLTLAFVVTMVIVIGGFILIGSGHDWAGGSVISANALGLAGMFIYGQESRKKERQARIEAALQNPRPAASPTPSSTASTAAVSRSQ